MADIDRGRARRSWHGPGELAEPDWPPLTDDELSGVLGRPAAPGGLGRLPVVTWRSPRPMSAAALVRYGDATVFVKRHHLSVRTEGQLAAEHAFAGEFPSRGSRCPQSYGWPGHGADRVAAR